MVWQVNTFLLSVGVMIAPHSPLTNAALMTEENYVSIRVAFAPILSGEFKHVEVGVVVPIGLYQSVGVTVLDPGGYSDAGSGYRVRSDCPRVLFI